MIACPDCGGELRDLDTPVCPSCGRHFEQIEGVPELLSRGDLDSAVFTAYRQHYDRLAADDLERSIQLEDHHRLEIERLQASLGDVRGLDVCDVGTGKGLLLDLLERLGAATVTGVEVARPYLRELATRPAQARLVAANAERLPFAAEFDVVASTDVLEHVLNPGDFLLSVHRALRPGGRFVVRVPYRDNLVAYSRLAGYPYAFVHLRAFDRRGLRDLLQQGGFAVRSMTFSSFYTMKLRTALSANRRLERLLRMALEKRYGGAGMVTRIDPRIGRLLMRPNTLTAVAARREGKSRR